MRRRPSWRTTSRRAFGAAELQGLKVFFAETATSPPSASEISSGGFGSCIACHQGPQFTDFLAHNVGAAQEEYDSVHGGGTLMALTIPDLNTRSTNADLFLLASGAHPTRMGVFRRVPSLSQPMFTDLGLWSVLGNGDIPIPQQPILDVLCAVNNMPAGTCTTAQGRGLSVALFKTPGLRSLGQGAPYFHTGRKDTLDDVVTHYQTMSAQARANQVRNADPRLANIALTGIDVAPLVAFLNALNEDYQ